MRTDLNVHRRSHRSRATIETLEKRTLMSAATDATGLYATVQAQGETTFNLQPIESTAAGVSTRIAFGVPFPRGFVTDLSKVRILDAGGAEKAASVALLTPWRDLGALTDEASVRSALVQIDVAFPDSDGDGDADPVTLKVAWGGAARALP